MMCMSAPCEMILLMVDLSSDSTLISNLTIRVPIHECVALLSMLFASPFLLLLLQDSETLGSAGAVSDWVWQFLLCQFSGQSFHL